MLEASAVSLPLLLLLLLLLLAGAAAAKGALVDSKVALAGSSCWIACDHHMAGPALYPMPCLT